MNRVKSSKPTVSGIFPGIIPILISLLSLGFAKGAEGLRLLPDSAEALGKAGGKFATLSDPSVVRLNPANLSLIEGNQFMVNASLLHGSTRFTSPQGSDRMDSPWKYTGSFYFASNIPDSPWAFGLGLSAPTGLDMKWDQNDFIGQIVPFKGMLFNAAISPAASYDFNDKISIGFGLDITWSRLELAQLYPLPIVDTLISSAEGWGVSPFAAISWDFADCHRLSVVARAPMQVDYEGDSNATVNVPGISPKSFYGTEIEFPGSVAVGYAFDLSEDFRIGIDYEWIQNSTHDDLPQNLGVNRALFPPPNLQPPLDWKNSWNLGFGLEKDLSDTFTLRGGYMYSKSPMPDATFTPLVPANDRHLITTGFGVKRACHSIDAAYALGLYEDRHITNNQDPRFNGDWEFLWHQFTVSYTYKF